MYNGNKKQELQYILERIQEELDGRSKENDNLCADIILAVIALLGFSWLFWLALTN